MTNKKAADSLEKEANSIDKEITQIRARLEKFNGKQKLTKAQQAELEAEFRKMEELGRRLDETTAINDSLMADVAKHAGLFKALSANIKAANSQAAHHNRAGEHSEAMKIYRDMSKEHMEASLIGWEWWAKTELINRGWKVTESENRWHFSYGGVPVGSGLPPEARLLVAIRTTKGAIESGDPLWIASVSFNLMLNILATGQAHVLYPMSLDIARDAIQAARARKPRRPRLRTRAMLAAFADGRHTADAVEGFFRDGGVYEDQWGEISIYPDGGEFVVTDEGAKLSAGGQRPTATIKKSSLPTLIAQTRKKPA